MCYIRSPDIKQQIIPYSEKDLVTSGKLYMRYWLEKECSILLLFEKEEVIYNITGGYCTCLELRE